MQDYFRSRLSRNTQKGLLFHNSHRHCIRIYRTKENCMKKFTLFILALAGLGAACGGPAGNAPAASNASVVNAVNANSAKPVAAAPTKDDLVALEKGGWE